MAFLMASVMRLSSPPESTLTLLKTSSPVKWNAARRSRAVCGVMLRLE